MEEFIEEMERRKYIIDQMNLKESSIYKMSRLRELLGCVFSENPKIMILDGCNSEGDVRFEISMESLGLNYNKVLRLKSEISNDFFINLVGEYLVRENMSEFMKIIGNLKDDYHSVVNKYNHKKFGMKIIKDKFIFIFHISLVQNILTEDFKKVR